MNYSRSFIVRAQIGIESNGHGQYAKLYTMRQYKSHPWKCVSSLAKYNSSLSIPLRLVDGRTISWRSLSTTATTTKTTKKKTRTRSEGSSRRPSQPLRIGNQDSSVRGRDRSGGPLENQDVNGGRWSRGIRNQSAPDARPFSLHQSASDVAAFARRFRGRRRRVILFIIIRYIIQTIRACCYLAFLFFLSFFLCELGYFFDCECCILRYSCLKKLRLRSKETLRFFVFWLIDQYRGFYQNMWFIVYL